LNVGEGRGSEGLCLDGGGTGVGCVEGRGISKGVGCGRRDVWMGKYGREGVLAFIGFGVVSLSGIGVVFR